MSRHPIDEVYADVLGVACPNCRAQPGEYCLNRYTRKPSKIPCTARFKARAEERPQLPLHPEETL